MYGRGSFGTAPEMHDLFENVRDRFHQLRSIANERMAPARQGVVHRSRDREDLAALVRREAGGDQRAAAQRRLDDQNPERQTAD